MKCQNCGADYEGNFCHSCGSKANEQYTPNEAPAAPIPVERKSILQKSTKKKPVYEKWWFWVLIVIVLSIVFANIGKDKDDGTQAYGGTQGDTQISTQSDAPGEEPDEKVKVEVVDFGSMEKTAIQTWADENKVKCSFSEDYSDTVANGKVISQSKKVGENIKQGDKIKVVISLGKKPSKEYQSALKSAEQYSDIMNMSKKGIYDQLTSEYGDRFPADAAQYAIDNVQADWNKNALESAKSYYETMNMSKKGIYDQLTSEYGGQFEPSEAQYAIDNLKADWNKAALESAKSYQSLMNMSNNAIYDQLVSDYGDQFTASEAQYAIDNLG